MHCGPSAPPWIAGGADFCPGLSCAGRHRPSCDITAFRGLWRFFSVASSDFRGLIISMISGNSPSALGADGLRAVSEFRRIILAVLKSAKTELGGILTFLGLGGNPPISGMLLAVDFPDFEKLARCARIEHFVESGRIGREELESLTGRLSISQTSIFGRIGRAMTHPRYRKANLGFYQSYLTDSDVWVLRWRAGFLRSIRSQIVYPLRPTQQKITYARAATSAQIIAAVVLDKVQFDRGGRVEAARMPRARDDWGPLFKETNWIFGLELLPVVQIAADPNIDIDDKCIAFYVGNSPTQGALIRASSLRGVIEAVVRIFRDICAKRRISPWFEHDPSGVNISDLPIRNVALPCPVISEGGGVRVLVESL